MSRILLLIGLSGCAKMGPIVDYHDEIDDGLRQALMGRSRHHRGAVEGLLAVHEDVLLFFNV